MTITKKVADELIAHLQRPTISIPELQEEMVISYREAHSLIEFAIKRMWLNPQAEGIDYQTVPSAFIPKSLNAEQCKKVYDILGIDELKVLFYFVKNKAPSFQDIIKDVDDDEDDMHDAIDTLIASNILVEFSGTYYCNISNKSIKKIKECQKNDEQVPDRFRRMMEGLG